MGLLNAFRQLGLVFTSFTERWVPDAWIISMMLTAIAILLCIFGAGDAAVPIVHRVEATILAWGDGVWLLLGLAMQFSIAMVAASAVVASPPMYRFFDWLASMPNPNKPVQAVMLAAAFSLVTGYLNWAVCLVSCALFTPFILKRNPNTDVRVLIAAAYIGIGTVWHGGLSGSAPLILATPGNPLIEPSCKGKEVCDATPVVDQLYPVTETLFNSWNLGIIAILGAVGFITVCLLHPSKNARTLTPEQIDAIMPAPPVKDLPPSTPAEYLDQFRGWTLLAVVLFAYPLGYSIATKGFGTSWTINAYNVTFLVLALLLHGRPTSFLRACRRGVDSAWGIIVQFPFYAGIFGLLQFTNLGKWLGEIFAELGTQTTYPFIVYVYSGVMNLFVPSAGSKWLIEAPFLIPAGNALDVSVITVTLAYAYGDSVTNLIQPFFAIPILAVTRMRFGDIVGYTFLVAGVIFAVSSVLMFILPPQL
jgi:short-chain fatty acids transporter